MSLNKPEVIVDNEYGLVYNADTQSYKVLRIIPSSEIRGIEKMSEDLSNASENSNPKKNLGKNVSCKTTTVQFLSLSESNKVMSDIASKKNQANEFVLAADEKNRSYQLVRTSKENDANQGAVGSAKQLPSVEQNGKKLTEKAKTETDKKSKWVTIELVVPFDDSLSRKIKMLESDTFEHLLNCWQMETGSNIRLCLVINTADGSKFVRESDTPQNLSKVEYGEMVFFDLGPPDVYWDDREF